jgi:mycothiol synthase
MTAVTVSDPPDASVVDVLRAYDHASRAERGHEAIPEAAFRALATLDGQCLAVRADGDAVVGVTFPSDSFTPRYRQLAIGRGEDATDDAVIDVARAAVAADPATLTCWLPGTDPVIADGLEAAGFTVDRRQHRMEVPLPRPGSVPHPAGVELRAFRPGTDETAWLRVNNRAFANHPDQGGWVAEVLARRMAESWFDPQGFLLAWREDDLLGFCWTKVHPGSPPAGEIFVIGVDPDAQGLGLGRALVQAGLADLSGRRGCTLGLLYVAASNDPALALYEQLGFRVVRTDTAYVHPGRAR